jgi:lipopolysaccharide biosynthesis glycosyltransferase
MRSICLSTKRRRDIVFHLFHRTLSREHEEALRKIETEFGAQLRFYDIDRDATFQWIMNSAPENKVLSNICYARLLFAETIDADVERLIYTDCDMFVRAPIERLAEMDMQGKSLAAAPDYLGQRIMMGRMMVDPNGIFDPAMRYFNAGLMVIDMKRWREKRVIEKFRTMLDNGTLKHIYYDQDFLNLTFEDDWVELSQLWNFLDPRPLHEPLNPHLLHYTGAQKPWILRTKAAFPRDYRYTMTNDVYYRFLAERSPKWLRPLVMWAKRRNG